MGRAQDSAERLLVLTLRWRQDHLSLWGGRIREEQASVRRIESAPEFISKGAHQHGVLL